MLHHLTNRANLDDAARIHHCNPIGGFGDHAHVVSDQHDGGSMIAPKTLQQCDDLRLNRHVERRRRLIGDDEFGLGASASAITTR